MAFTLYILYDRKRDKYYIGQTANIEDRLKRHFNKRSRYTKTGEWRLVYQESYQTRSKAVGRERYLKSLKSKIAIKKLIGSVAQSVRASRSAGVS